MKSFDEKRAELSRHFLLRGDLIERVQDTVARFFAWRYSNDGASPHRPPLTRIGRLLDSVLRGYSAWLIARSHRVVTASQAQQDMLAGLAKAGIGKIDFGCIC